mgnify:CR=1 FL=1
MLRTPITLLMALALVFTVACNNQEAEDTDTQDTATEETVSMEETEVEIAVDDLPAEVLAAFNEAYAGAEILGAFKETENGEVIFEIACKHNEANMEIEYAPDGSMVAEEKMIAIEELPDNIAAAAREAHAEMTIDEAEMITLPDGTVQYEVVMEDENDNEVEILFDAEGNIIETENDTDDDDEHDDEDHDEEEDD